MIESKTIGKLTELTLVTPIKTGMIPKQRRSYRTSLTETLRDLHVRHALGRATAPDLLGSIHFARWFIVDDPSPRCACAAPSERPGSLVLCTNFDGDLGIYLRDFTLKVPDEIDSVWGCCVDYPPDGCRDWDRFFRWIRAYQVETLAFLVGSRTATVGDIESAQIRAGKGSPRHEVMA